jgi:formylglycine-generating enzyme required for sulfatase activity
MAVAQPPASVRIHISSQALRFTFHASRFTFYIALSAFVVACNFPRLPPAPGDMVRVPAGPFRMGADRVPPDSLRPEADEGPQHTVRLDAYWIDRYEVTNAQFRDCARADACAEPDDLRYYADATYADHPVVFVTWYDARDYCGWAGKRLPSEAEWEKAARGTDGRIYPWGTGLALERLNADYRVGTTTAVGSYPGGASPYGAYDMAGNVWEWTSDWYAPYPGSSVHSDLFGEKYKVLRGGSWNHPPEDARVDHRDVAHPERAIQVVGFRCALDDDVQGIQ